MKDDRLHDAPEDDLIYAARFADRAAFDELMERHLGEVWRIAWRIVRDDREAADVTRESMLAAFRTLPAFPGDVPFALWLDRIAVGRALKLLERHDAGRRPPVGGPTGLDALDRDEAARRLADCRLRLAPPLRAVLVLRDAEGMSWRDIEKVFGLPMDALRHRVLRARIALWRCIAARHDSEEVDEALAAWGDDDLPEADRTAIQKKLAKDPALKHLAAEMGRLRELTAKDATPVLPPNLADRIRAELPAGSTAPRRRKLHAPSSGPARRRGPLATVLVLLLLVAAGAGFLFGTAPGARLLDRLRGSAPAATAAEPQPVAEPAPAETAPAPAETTPPQAAPTAPTEPAPAPVESPAPAPAIPEQAPPTPVPQAAPEPTPQPTTPPETTAATPPAVPGACTNTWQATRRALRWSGAPPANPARALGGLAQRLGGKGLLREGDPPSVRISVPAARWAELNRELRAQGVEAVDGTPPAGSDCAALVVEAPAPAR